MSWEESSSWYNDLVGKKGHYYHEHIILPKTLSLLNLIPQKSSLLDLACGQGVLARALPKGIDYLGVDLSPSLIAEGKKLSSHRFQLGDITSPLSLDPPLFSHATLILALQNVPDPLPVFHNVQHHLIPGGMFLIVMNHPCFRIPRQSMWGIDPEKRIQYRRIERYFSPMKIPIKTHPGKQGELGSAETWSFHYPLSHYARCLREAGLAIFLIEEWISDKKSMGKEARMENRSREEFPLFLALLCRK